MVFCFYYREFWFGTLYRSRQLNLLKTILTWIMASWVISTPAAWPDFRGPSFDGIATPVDRANPTGLPVRWSETENVTWKAPVPFRGWSSPVVMDQQIWLTTATPDGHEFFAICVAADSGKIVFNERIFRCDAPEPLGNNLNSYASCSPVIEAGRVYVHFGSYGTACLDTGRFKVIWKRDDLPCKHFRGPGSSPVLAGELLILTMDGIDFQYLVALDKLTGQTVWKTNRTANWNDIEADGQPRGGGDFRKAYATPLLIDFDGRQQLLTIGSKAAYSYDPATGREIWKLNHAGFSPAARPVFDGKNAYVATGNGKGEMLSVRVDGQGDVTDTHINWRNGRGFPRMPSPVLVHGLLLMVSDSGIVSCLEAVSGKELWQERLGGDYAASLLYGDGRVYCFGQDGKATVLNAARTYEVLASNRLNDGFMASPAVDGRALILRTKTHLYRIEEAAKP